MGYYWVARSPLVINQQGFSSHSSKEGPKKKLAAMQNAPRTRRSSHRHQTDVDDWHKPNMDCSLLDTKNCSCIKIFKMKEKQLFIYISIYTPMSIFLSFYISIFLSIYLSIFLSFYLYIYIYIHTCTYIYIYIYYTYAYLSEDSNQHCQETFLRGHESPSKQNMMYQ